MNYKSICMPLKPKLNVSGYKILPLVTNVVGEMLDCETDFTFNILHGFKDSGSIVDEFVEELNEMNIVSDNVIYDKNFVEKAKENIVNLYRKGVVQIEEKEVLNCGCGIISTTKENLTNISKMKLAHIEDGEIVCNKCGGKCNSSVQRVLVLKTKDVNLTDIQIFPENFSKEINDLLNSYKDTSILLSKTRETGVKLNIENETFNIDVDMIWSQYLSFYNNTNIATVGSSHVLFAMVLSYIMERAINGTNNVMFLAVPYLKNANPNVDMFMQAKSSVVRKLLTMFCCKWNSKECYFSQEIFDKLNQLSEQGLADSYEIMTKYSDGVKNSQMENESPYKYLCRLIKYGTNFQKNLQNLKNKINK